MSGPAFTPTRELASAAAQKASDAYAATRQTNGLIDGLRADIADLRGEIAELRASLRPEPTRKTKR